MSAEDDVGVSRILLGRPNKVDALVFVEMSQVLGGGVPCQLEVALEFHMFCWAAQQVRCPSFCGDVVRPEVMECRVS